MSRWHVIDRDSMLIGFNENVDVSGIMLIRISVEFLQLFHCEPQ